MTQAAEIYQFPGNVSQAFAEYWEHIEHTGCPVSEKRARTLFHMTPEQYFANAGWVYVLRNPMLPANVFKIGKTTGAIQRRMRQLYTTGVPRQFELANARWCRDCSFVERGIHEHLAEFRVSGNREFFQVDLKRITQAINYVVAFCDPPPDHMIDLMFARWDYATKTETVNGKLVVERQPPMDPSEVPF